MTGPDDSPDGFLERWSRRKIEAEREPAPPAEPGAADAPPPSQAALPDRPAGNPAPAAAETVPQPDFDLASLPSLDSITAVTDIRQFLSPGVPKELARAALRRAWAADPAVRDFVGLAENAWDFTDPAAMPGFGPLPEGTDIKKLVAQIFGEGERSIDPKDELVPPSPPGIAGNGAPGTGSEPSAAAPPTPAGEPGPSLVEASAQQVTDDIVRCSSIIATHNSRAEDAAEEPKNPRQHGGALPQ
jgi:hypothetical protein